MSAPLLATVVGQTRDIDGWLTPLDVALLLAAGAHQAERGTKGDLLEIGAYRGRSAIVLGHLRRPDERVIVCDVFEDGSADPETSAEWHLHYQGLAQAQFEANWAKVHPAPPTIVRAPSSELASRLAPGTVRLVHVDGSHLEREVAADIDTVLRLATPGVVLVFDDIFRSGSPGVAAAVWPAVAAGRLQPALVSSNKLYATVGDPDALRAGLLHGIEALHDLEHDRQLICGNEVAIVAPHPDRDPVTGRTPLPRQVDRVLRRLLRG